ncbi:NAD+ kinase [Malonomonas rubra DSM 5091]|uniref:NAD kinase n=1 Tax=Malonomonas rubra DSM 5091 TaxID=1122189 RepID=A0A1M6C0G0_MALRU|nr:NAD(+)/NADH kinase [Malonomonas rubra]SHI54477.1 NAD+ kinase [Malonomonas rubra DSM 5091]
MLKKVGVYAKKNHPDAEQLALMICERLKKENIEVLLEDGLAEQIGQVNGFSGEDIPGQVDLIIVLGGDGTLISVARQIGELTVPILGVNLGRLGFLTEVTRDELPGMLELIARDEFQISDRMMLDAIIHRGDQEVGRYTVLNDVVINKGALARIIDMETCVDGRHLSTYKADGLIISTPTGSTGYNLAAGGPIIYPEINSLVISPICPHMLTNRPIVVWSRSKIEIKVKFEDDVVFFTADGQVGRKLLPGDVVEVRRSEARTRLVSSPSKDYFEILRTKLSWGER